VEAWPGVLSGSGWGLGSVLQTLLLAHRLHKHTPCPAHALLILPWPQVRAAYSQGLTAALQAADSLSRGALLSSGSAQTGAASSRNSQGDGLGNVAVSAQEHGSTEEQGWGRQVFGEVCADGDVACEALHMHWQQAARQGAVAAAVAAAHEWHAYEFCVPRYLARSYSEPCLCARRLHAVSVAPSQHCSFGLAATSSVQQNVVHWPRFIRAIKFCDEVAQTLHPLLPLLA